MTRWGKANYPLEPPTSDLSMTPTGLPLLYLERLTLGLHLCSSNRNGVLVLDQGQVEKPV